MHGFPDDDSYKRDKIFDNYTYEIVKIFHTMLKFGMYTSYISNKQNEQ